MDRKIWLTQHVKVWFTDMLPNIGLFLCRGNSKTAEVFKLAWQKYEVMVMWSVLFCSVESCYPVAFCYFSIFGTTSERYEMMHVYCHYDTLYALLLSLS